MKTNLRFACLLALTCVLTAFTAHAQTLRLYVASYGNDANSGSRTSPKRTFQAAHDAMSSGGDIYGLDTAGYATGTLNITKSISITMSPGCEGIVTATGGHGIFINAGLRVSLRGLRVEATGPNNGAGISINSASSVEVDNCTITGFGSSISSYLSSSGGIVINTASVVGSTVITDTLIKDCPGRGISFGYNGAGTNSSLMIEHCRLLANAQGLYAPSTGQVTLRNSLVSNSTGAGIYAAGDVKVNVEHCAVTDNSTGIFSFNSLNVTVSNTAITGNTLGVTRQGGGGGPLTFGNNQLTNNVSDGTMSTVLTQK